MGGRLVAVAGPDAAREFEVASSGVVGRDTHSAIVLHDDEASRRHAVLTVSDGTVAIEDLGSTNGTFVNAQRVLGPRALHDGDVVQVGTTQLRYEAQRPAGQRTVVAPRPPIQPTVIAPLQQVPPAFGPLPLFGPRPEPGAPHEREGLRGARLWTLVVVCIGTFMLLLDTTVVNVALPKIQKGLHATFPDLQWVVNAYSLALAVVLLTAGSLADLMGRRRIFCAGLVVFSLSSLACGLAPSPLALNLARGVQGIGAAAMFATSLALLANAFRGPGRGLAFGVWGAVTGAAVALGPLVGGLLTDAFGWESIFFVNVPISVLALTVALTRVDESRDPDARGVDWAGLATFSGAMLLLVFALTEGNDKGWTSTRILAMLGGAVVLLGLFLVAETVQERPMLDLGLFRNRSFVGVSIVAFVMSAAGFSMFLYLTLYLQTVLGFSPLATGLRFLPITLVSFILAPLAGGLSSKVPARIFLALGLAMSGGGLLLMHGITTASKWTALLGGFVLLGAGIGLVNPPLASAAVGVVPPERSGMAAGINTTFREIGMAVGIAGLGAAFQTQVQTKVLHALAGAPSIPSSRAHALAHQVATGDAQAAIQSVAPASRGILGSAFHSAFVSGLQDILLIAASVAFAGAVLALALVRSRDFVTDPRSGEHIVVGH